MSLRIDDFIYGISVNILSCRPVAIFIYIDYTSQQYIVFQCFWSSVINFKTLFIILKRNQLFQIFICKRTEFTSQIFFYVNAYWRIIICISCGTCAASCPVEAISQGDAQYEIDADACIDCGACEGTCPVGAISEA